MTFVFDPTEFDPKKILQRDLEGVLVLLAKLAYDREQACIALGLSQPTDNNIKPIIAQNNDGTLVFRVGGVPYANFKIEIVKLPMRATDDETDKDLWRISHGEQGGQDERSGHE